jgi:hypothetical protein
MIKYLIELSVYFWLKILSDESRVGSKLVSINLFLISCLAGNCPFPAPNGHHHERSRGETVYQNGSTDASFDPPLFSLDSTFNGEGKFSYLYQRYLLALRQARKQFPVEVRAEAKIKIYEPENTRSKELEDFS